MRKSLNSLVGKKIELRQYSVSDAPHIHRWRVDSGTTIWMGRKFRHIPTIDEVSESLRRVIASKDTDCVFFAISEIGTHRYIGGIDLTSIDEIDKNGVLSIVIGSTADRGKGFASESIRLLLDFAFGSLKLHKVSLNVNSRNSVAVECYRSLGFREDGRQRYHHFIDGSFSDLILRSILESEYLGNLEEKM